MLDSVAFLGLIKGGCLCFLAGGMSTGQDILAAQAMGASACYFGTRFIATRESLSDDATRDMMVAATAKDIFFSAALDGAPANWLRPSLIQEGLDPDVIAAYTPGQRVQNQAARARYSKIKSAGHGVGMIESVESAADLCDRIIDEYNRSKRAFANNLLRVTA